MDITAHEPLVIRSVNRRLRRMGLPGVRRTGPGRVAGPEIGRELHQEGMLALHLAQKRFNPKKGRLSTIATRYIEGAIGRALKKQGPVHIGERAVRQRMKAGVALPKGAGLEAVDFERTSTGGLRRSDAALRLRSLTKGLPLRERRLLLASGEQSQGTLARKFGISKTRVNQLLARTKRQLRQKEAA